TTGPIPPGTFVLLRDGTVGIAAGSGASGDPLQPDVLVAGVRVSPLGPVRLLSRRELDVAT
ncbi:hypothetical protein ACFL59_12220, partial [Planctomycetota bacterium]